jgi:hypothetical protein
MMPSTHLWAAWERLQSEGWINPALAQADKPQFVRPA